MAEDNPYPIGTFYNDASQLPQHIQELLAKAHDQLELAYAPYSNFQVGAAILYNEFKIAIGSNQENASYPLCMCAERVALYEIGANNKTFDIEAIAITARNLLKPLKDICMPCGACRQVIQEFEMRQNKTITLYLTAAENKAVLRIDKIEDLLPYSFSKDHLI